MNIVVGDPLYRPFPKNRLMLSDDPRDLDYALFHDIAQRYLQHDPKKFRREALRIAEEKKSPRLLELVGLLCAMESNYGQAGDFLQHARALYEEPVDQLRCSLYEAEIAKRKGDPNEGLAIVQRIIADSKLGTLPAMSAVMVLQRAMKGK